LRRTVKAEPAVRQRSLVAAQKKAMHAQGRAEIAVKAAPLEAPQALARLERKRADVQFAEQHLQAAKNIPSRGMTETHEQYAKRLVSYARTHDLKLLENRATKLLAAKPTNLAKGYFPRDFEQRALKQLGLTADEAGTRVVRTGTAPSRAVGAITSGFKRSENRVLSTVNPEREAAGKVPFSTNVPLVALNQLKQSAKAVSQGEFAKSMANVGRPIKDVSDLKPGEGLYKLGYRGGQFGLHEVKGIPAKPTKGGQYVALNRTLLDEMQGATRQVRAGSQTGRGFDKLTGGWKRLATATPGFHIRNLLGDTQQAYLAAPGQQLPRNIAQAGKAIRRANEQAKSIRPSATNKTLKVAGQRVHIDEFLKGAREHGVLDAGYIGRELHDLGGQASEKAGRVRSGRGAGIDRWMTNRENLMRLATYKAGLDKGMTNAEASDLANLFHVDYGELSDFERKVLRRALPFYTWTARSLPVTAKTLVTKPGKFANIEKVREDIGQASTGQSDDQQRSRMTANQQRQLPFVIKIGKGAQAVSASLPAMLLNELPTGTSTKDLGAYLDELGRFGFQMLNPALKTPIELRTGVSTFTRQPIENPQRPLVAAPAWVRYLPDQVKRQLEVTPDYVDKRTGKKAWGWRGRADYAYHLIPGAPAQVGQIASGGRPGQPNSPAAALAGALGIRVDSLSDQAATHAQNTQVYKRLADLNRRAAELNQQGISHDHPTREYTALRAQINALTAQVSPRKRKVSVKPLSLSPSGGKLPLSGDAAKLPLG
ncbi:MAG: hypothetical protein QOF51_2344, partial [Chloroflexota bacterium]|nr:hypothetical protein [Chloroflexota bacterium]